MRRMIMLIFCAVIFMPFSAMAAHAPLKIVVTFSILQDLTKQVGGDLVEVTTLVGPDGDAHTYKPTPNDAKNLMHADLVIENGLGLEGWLDRLISASGYKGPLIIASNGIVPRQMDADEEGAAETAGKKIIDPHAWQDIANARIYVRNIAAALIKALPEKADIINAQAKAYDAKLQELDAYVRNEIKGVPVDQRKIITSHDAFNYFGAAYGVTFMAPQGISTEVEPSAAQVAKLVNQMKTEKIKRVFFENMASPKLISQLAKDAGASVGKPVYSDALSKADGEATTYVDMFHYNISQFKEAMLLNGK